MWKLISIHAKNLCAFKELSYRLHQDCTTLIFGNNMDNDSQGSNGSGKSAMLEAIAIGLTGEPLRKIKMEEIINDAENEAVVSVVLQNQEGRTMTVNRRLSRKSPQDIQILVDTEEIAQATVADYNKYVLEAVGLTKDDLYANFILSKNKYTSFLSSSDREKKEIINRFSNGNLVDESIVALQEDIVPVEKELSEATTNVAVVQGRIDALQQQIDMALTDSTERSKKKAERIAGWKQAIADKRTYIRGQEDAKATANELLDKYTNCDNALQKCEESDKNLAGCYELICNKFNTLQIKTPADYTAQTAQYQQQVKTLEKELKDLNKQVTKCDKALEAVKATYDKVKARYDKFQNEYGTKSVSIQKKIDTLLDNIRSLEKENTQLNTQHSSLVKDIANLEKQLAGVIVCPNCKHEFTLSDDIDISDVRLRLQDRQGEAKDIEEDIEANQKNISEFTAKGKEVREKQNELLNSKTEWSQKLTDAQTAVDDATRESSTLSSKVTKLNEQIAKLTKDIEDARTNLFDETYNLLDAAYKIQESAVDAAQLNISNAEGAIQSYEESIEATENAAETDIISNLKTSLANSKQELTKAMSKQEAIQKKLNTYKVQEATFVEFKTHLANTKIEALSHITNEFLEGIGSDIRIVLSGFTVLKSGKIRDKISVSLLRDGIDCGSFDKFSAGERARVELAMILAMNKLTNASCDDEKGLDLLVLDEILEAVDEQGLNNIFNALNRLQITSLVVSHGNIAENYPYKTVVNKLNGVSYLDEQQQ